MEPRLNYWGAAPELMQAVLALNTAIESGSIEKSLQHLVKMRASQINGCAYCCDMHAREARKEGETEQRLYVLSAWHDSFLYSDRERAAFAWTEAVTKLGADTPTDALYAATSAHFSDKEIADLTALITMINTWNRFAISFRTLHAKDEAAAA
ncbi:MAG: carboxymuconolactone decarboxylase family protein [Thalassovita sp.]